MQDYDRAVEKKHVHTNKNNKTISSASTQPAYVSALRSEFWCLLHLVKLKIHQSWAAVQDTHTRMSLIDELLLRVY